MREIILLQIMLQGLLIFSLFFVPCFLEKHLVRSLLGIEGFFTLHSNTLQST